MDARREEFTISFPRPAYNCRKLSVPKYGSGAFESVILPRDRFYPREVRLAGIMSLEELSLSAKSSRADVPFLL